MLPRVFTIPFSAPFLPTFVDALFEGALIPGVAYRDDPLALADLTLYLPTRRAGRLLADVLIARQKKSATVLPRILPLGGLDEGEDEEAWPDPAALFLPPRISEPERLLTLARLLLDASSGREPGEGTDDLPFLSVPQALFFARDLLALLDEADREGVEWQGLDKLVPDDHANWWRVALAYLKTASETFPNELKRKGVISATEQQTRIMHELAARLERHPPSGPVIAAGSTGSRPATARLLRAIAYLDQGAVVLPGLDLNLDENIFKGLGEGSIEGAASHPQTLLAKLLRTMGIERRAVRPLVKLPLAMRRRESIITGALLPVAYTERWPVYAALFDMEKSLTAEALEGMALVVARNEAEEALAIAVALRETVEMPGAKAALVTPDRQLARRVASELARFGIHVDDSAGTPLTRTMVGSLALMVADMAVDGITCASLAALIAHPLARFGMPALSMVEAAHALELLVLRGYSFMRGGGALIEAVQQAIEDEERRAAHPALAALSVQAREGALRLAQAIAAVFQSFERLAGGEKYDFKVLLGLYITALHAVSAEEEAKPIGDPGWTVLMDCLADYRDAPAPSFQLAINEFARTMRLLFDPCLVRAPVPHARISIWGTLEARLMAVDRLVVGGLNENLWPFSTDPGPWLSRPMRARLKFPPPEQRIGQAAHDFAAALGHRDVVLTRSSRAQGAPTMPTRFLQRLQSLLGQERDAAMRARGERFLAYARHMDDLPPLPRATRPEPRPPLAARPRRLSVDEIETLIVDPYTIYARHILGLRPLPPFGRKADSSVRGKFLRKILKAFAERYPGALDAEALSFLIRTGREYFTAYREEPETYTLWWPRFVTMAGHLVKDFQDRHPVIHRLADVKGKWAVIPGPEGFTLTATASQIDLLPEGKAALFDFAMRGAPGSADIAFCRTPKLPLLGAILKRGGFREIGERETSAFVFLDLRGGSEADCIKSYGGYEKSKGKPTLPLSETIEIAEERLQALISAYRDPQKAYLPYARRSKRRGAGFYDHLARVAEWMNSGPEDNDEEGGAE